MPDVESILRTMALVGADLPAYGALLNQVTMLFTERDQAALQVGYINAVRDAEAAHRAAQSV